MKQSILDFLDYEKKILNRNHDHIMHNKWNLTAFSQFVSFKFGISDFSDCKFEHVVDFLSHIRETPIQCGPNIWKIRSQNCVAWYSASLRWFFKYWNQLWKPWMNRGQIPLIPKERKTLDRCRPEEYKVFRNAPFIYEKDQSIAQRNQLLIDIPRNTGLRRAEFLRCTFENFMQPHFQFEVLGKWWYVDGVCFNQKIRDEVLQYFETVNKIQKIKKENLIFFSLSNHNFWNKMNEKSVNLIFQKYSSKLIRDWLLQRPITPHMERHSFATNCVLSWLSQQATTKLMRHRNPTTTLRYYHLNDERIADQYSKINL